jgi:hypothetical protein
MRPRDQKPRCYTLPDETPGTIRKRIFDDIAAGRRCARCWLLVPCMGHKFGEDATRRRGNNDMDLL